jgi:hypothetical protein
MVTFAPIFRDRVHVVFGKQGAEERMSSIDSRVQERHKGNVCLPKRRLSSGCQVSYPLGLLKRPQATEEELGRRARPPNLRYKIKQVYRFLKCFARCLGGYNYSSRE